VRRLEAPAEVRFGFVLLEEVLFAPGFGAYSGVI